MGATADEIVVNQNDVDTYSDEYHGAAIYLTADTDINIDSKSTISAKQNSVDAYLIGESLLENLGVHIDKEASNIRETGLTFKQYDEMLAGFEGNGYRVPTLVQG